MKDYKYKQFIVQKNLDENRTSKTEKKKCGRDPLIISSKYSGCAMAKTWCQQSHAKKCIWNSTN